MNQPIEPEVKPVLDPEDPDWEPTEEPPVEPPGSDTEPDLPPVEFGVETPFAGLGIPELENATPEQAAQMYETAKRGMVATRRELDAIQSAPPGPTDITQDEFYSDTPQSFRTIVSEELGRTVAPILNEINEGKKDRLFDRFRVKYGDDFVSLEPYILSMFEGKGTEIDEWNLFAAYSSARGLRGLGVPGGPVEAPVTAAPLPPRPNVTPPHQSPTSPPAPPRPGDKPVPLTEEEREYCKLAGLTHEEYRELGSDEPLVLGEEE